MMNALALPVADLLNNVNGLPTHALLVHFTVVVSTLGAVAGLAYALVPRFRRWLSVPLMVVGVASIVLGLITPASGERLEARLGEEPLIERHAELGDQMGLIMIAFGVLLIITMAVVRYRLSRNPDDAPPVYGVARIGAIPGWSQTGFGAQPVLASLLTILVLAGSVVSGIWIFRTGEAGAKSVWHDTPVAAPAGAQGDDGDDG
ncbi:MAG: hypothetical protein Q7T55_05050 [Solirubrobacteraceae bacterium]|nr:hypothetical protein [Solirubrobacteraceae bacterium]